MSYEYHLHYRGEIVNTGFIERELGIKERDFWFEGEAERDSFERKLKSIADQYGVRICFSKHDGYDVRLKTIANMKFKLPSGEVIPFSYDFGYGYEEGAARYMFEEGNYACDCNRSLFLDLDEYECGDEIGMLDFVVTKA